MKKLVYILIITMFSSLAGEVSAQQAVSGVLKYKPTQEEESGSNAALYMASVIIPVPGNGVPLRIRAAISSKDSHYKTSRFVFLNHQRGNKGENTFNIRGGDIVAEIGLVDPQKEAISIYLIYPVAEQASEGTRNRKFQQEKVELSEE